MKICYMYILQEGSYVVDGHVLRGEETIEKRNRYYQNVTFHWFVCICKCVFGCIPLTVQGCVCKLCVNCNICHKCLPACAVVCRIFAIWSLWGIAQLLGGTLQLRWPAGQQNYWPHTGPSEPYLFFSSRRVSKDSLRTMVVIKPLSPSLPFSPSFVFPSPIYEFSISNIFWRTNVDFCRAPIKMLFTNFVHIQVMWHSVQIWVPASLS